MTQATTHFTTEIRDRIDAFFARLGQGLNAYLESRCRRDRIEALEAKSDEELARMGLTRDGIPAYVFRDMIWL
ncbi:hypothetical protein [Paracoccus marinaquae]|uniref:DUF1127 domain-containing protein n=1 Tax=Paracoccus marinaquae TaxID=2841926 RepID=A0ABS6AL33_9RHOB|nr:hypothetical protein [Paracoccus marinaquae]MBU3031204.1 hypothetical protein [Paracoccus marinaquae]